MRKRTLLYTFIFAALVHLALSRIKVVYIPASELARLSKDAIEVTPLDPSVDKPVVQSSRLKEEDPEAKDAVAKYGGEFRNRVKKEMQAARKGKFQEGKGAPERVPGAEGEEAAPPGISDLMAYGMSPNEISKDIAMGGQTVLNTDPVKYASFINRIAEKIYDSWVFYARDAVKSVYLTGRKIDGNTYITRLQVVMDDQGEIRAIQTLAGSGITELDEAPKRAFWDVEPFRNPPAQMFEHDELVRFVYEFHFEWKTSSFSILPSAL